MARLGPLSNGDRVFFINAWKEWAEDAHFEPCQRWGRAYLEATRQAVAAHMMIGVHQVMHQQYQQ